MAYYTHDCEACKYLGTEKLHNKPADLYFCKVENPWPSMVIRVGDEEHEYSSADIQTLKEVEHSVNQTLMLMKRYYEEKL